MSTEKLQKWFKQKNGSIRCALVKELPYDLPTAQQPVSIRVAPLLVELERGGQVSRLI